MNNIFHIITTWSSSFIILILGCLLIAVGIPKTPQWKHLHSGCLCLSISYLILGITGLLESIAELSGELISIKPQLVLCISFFQAMLFTGTCLIFIRPQILNMKLILSQVLAITSLLAIFFGSFFIWPSIHPIIFGITLVAYFLQLTYYTYRFNKEYTQGIYQLEQHFCEEYAERLHWVKRLFYMSLAVGIIAFIHVVFPFNRKAVDFFSISYTIYYVYVVFCFITYGRQDKYIVGKLSLIDTEIETIKNNNPSTDAVQKNTTSETPQKHPDITIQESIEKEKIDSTPYTTSEKKETRAEKRLALALEEWVKNERYLCQDVPIEETAKELDTDVDSLHDYFLTHKGILFRTWRVMLRIEKAKQILETNPTIKISELQTKVGFSDKSYFFRRFKQITGKTPNEYRDCLQQNSNPENYQ